MGNSILKQRLAKWSGHACTAMLLFGTVVNLSSCKDEELLTGMPEWLGSSIYEELEERGAFTQTLALINDPDLSETNYPELLRRTGSMTLFVADDAAWERFLAKRGLTSVSQLPKAEKKNLLKSAMINSAYLIDLLSNTPGDPPSEGVCMRRNTRVDVEDSITILSSADMPEQATGRDGYVDHWSAVRDLGSIKLINRFRDDNGNMVDDPVPMVHFLPRFMAQNSITNEDMTRLSNGAATTIDRSYINGYAIARNDGRWPERDVETTGVSKDYLQDITCQNGYIHILEEVPEQLGNMAEVIASKPQFSIFSKLLERFSYPQWCSEQELNGQKTTFYTKRYFNSSLNHPLGNYVNENGTNITVTDKLSIDPGWNNYVLYRNSSGSQFSIAENEAAMFVPNNEMMEHYLKNDGAAIGVKYGSWDNVPDNLVIPFLNNCIQKSFVATVPSKFEAMKNTAAEEMGITTGDILNCYMACNGVVYEIGNVFAAPDHQSVLFPALLRADDSGDMKISNRVISFDPSSTSGDVRSAWKLNEFKAYLNSMSSTYSFLLPTDQAYTYYIDPFSYTTGQQPTGYVFYINSESSQPMLARAYLLDENGDLTSEEGLQPTIYDIANRLYDMMDNCIIVHGQKGAQTFHPEQTIYLTKSGSPVKVRFSGNKVTGIAGSMQMNKGEFTDIDPETEIFDMTEKGNGVTYIMKSLPQTTVISPSSLLSDTETHPEYAAFARLMSSSDFLAASEELDNHPSIGRPIKLFGNYHYTVYVPQKSAIDALVAAKKLPSEELLEEWELYETALNNYEPTGTEEEKDAREKEVEELLTEAKKKQNLMKDVINNFIRLHVQDGSVYLGGEHVTNQLYETASVDTLLSRFRTLSVTNTGDAITLSVSALPSVTAHVLSESSNQVTRQYLFGKGDEYDKNNKVWKTSGTNTTSNIFSSSYVVFQLIDNALYYDYEKQFLPADFGMPEYPEWLERPTIPDSEDPDLSPTKKYNKRR